MTRIDRQRSDDWKQRLLEVVVEEPLLLGGELPRLEQPDALGGEERLELIEESTGAARRPTGARAPPRR